MGLETNLLKLRTNLKLTQEEFAELLGVSRQAIQKWETGASRPDLDRIILMAKRFDVSIDTLLLNSDKRIAEELSHNRKIYPEYKTLHNWESYSAQLMVEFRQSMEEGKDVGALQDLFRAVSNMPASAEREKIANVLFDMVLNAKKAVDYPYEEPSERDAIRDARPQNGFLPSAPPPEGEDLRRRIRGAWLGRICGCLLGKPIECIRTNELDQLLASSQNQPLHRYIVSSDVTPELCEKLSYRLYNKPWADTVSCAPADDDTNYTVLAQLLIERHGRTFTPENVAMLWLESQTKNAYCTAERVAYRNFVNGYMPPLSAEYKNPYREWIGAQIRADYFGYINPGDPAAAADMAWRDACISHVKNGIYGEMYVAAMIAAAAVESNLENIVLAGLAQIPEHCRLAEAVHEVLRQFRAQTAQQEIFRYIHSRFDEHNTHDWCHTISNAMIVTAALLWGAGNYTKSICMAVETGFDTDCNGATVGSILGMRGGEGCIGAQWTAPLHGKLETTLFGVGTVEIEELVDRTLRHVAMR